VSSSLSFRHGTGHYNAAHRPADLDLSQQTVQTYCARIKEKIGLEDGAELSLRAIRWRETRRF